MPWATKSRGTNRLTVLALPAEVKCRLIQEKARTRKPFGQQICEALRAAWGPTFMGQSQLSGSVPDPLSNTTIYHGQVYKVQRVAPADQVCPWQV